MKRTILVALMVALIVTPCLGQEIEPDGLFSLHGTVWLVISPLQDPYPRLRYMAFYASKFYMSRTPSSSWTEADSPYTFYVDLLAISFFMGMGDGGIGPIGDPFVCIMSPLGFGFGFMRIYPLLLIKTDNNWTPEGVE